MNPETSKTFWYRRYRGRRVEINVDYIYFNAYPCIILLVILIDRPGFTMVLEKMRSLGVVHLGVYES